MDKVRPAETTSTNVEARVRQRSMGTMVREGECIASSIVGMLRPVNDEVTSNALQKVDGGWITDITTANINKRLFQIIDSHIPESEAKVAKGEIAELVQRIADAHCDRMRIENDLEEERRVYTRLREAGVLNLKQQHEKHKHEVASLIRERKVAVSQVMSTAAEMERLDYHTHVIREQIREEVKHEEEQGREKYKAFLLKEIQQARMQGEAWNKCVLEKETAKMRREADSSIIERMRVETQKLELQMQVDLHRMVAKAASAEREKWKRAIKEMEKPLLLVTQQVYNLQKECSALKKTCAESELQRTALEAELQAAKRQREACQQGLQDETLRRETESAKWRQLVEEKEVHSKKLAKELEVLKMAASKNTLKHALLRAEEDVTVSMVHQRAAISSHHHMGKPTPIFFKQGGGASSTKEHLKLGEILRSFSDPIIKD